MPTISRFLGIIIAIHFGDHPPPHFHVRYSGYKALIAINSLKVLRGGLPPPVLGLVVEWGERHRPELQRNWELALHQQALVPIPPLEQIMIPDIVSAQPLEGYRLRLMFDDGSRGEVDVRSIVQFVGVFAPLSDPEEFGKVRVDAETGTVTWPNGADLDPLVLYSKARGIAIEDVLADSHVEH